MKQNIVLQKKGGRKMIGFFSKRINNKKGFTLIELIVVIAILAILAVIAIPRLGQFRDAADVNVAEANEKMVNNLLALHHAERGDYPDDSELDSPAEIFVGFLELIEFFEEIDYIDATTAADLVNVNAWAGTLPRYTTGAETITR